MLAREVRKGRIKPLLTCQASGCKSSGRLQAHHNSYHRARSVIWLCGGHHRPAAKRASSDESEGVVSFRTRTGDKKLRNLKSFKPGAEWIGNVKGGARGKVQTHGKRVRKRELIPC
jgi:hypothetical protein